MRGQVGGRGKGAKNIFLSANRILELEIFCEITRLLTNFGSNFLNLPQLNSPFCERKGKICIFHWQKHILSRFSLAISQIWLQLGKNFL